MRTRDLVLAIAGTATGILTLALAVHAGPFADHWTEALWWLLLTLWNFHGVDRLLDRADRRAQTIRYGDIHIDHDASTSVAYLANKRRGGGL